MAQSDQFEYRVEEVKRDIATTALCAMLNGWGREGWEMVSTIPSPWTIVLCLKRKI